VSTNPRAELHDIVQRYAEWEIISPPERRSAEKSVSFSPWRR
jgi:hypothetical protein